MLRYRKVLIKGGIVMRTTRKRPPETIEAQQDELINLANDLARKKLADGTASSPVITHFLAMGTPEYQHQQERMQLKLERERLENELLRAKTDNLRAQTSSERLYAKAIEAFGLYNGKDFDDDDSEDYEDY